MSFHLLDSADLAASLRAAALLPPQLGVLPAGRIELNEAIDLDLWDRSLRLRARPGCTLVLNASLHLAAELLELEGLQVEGPGGLRLEATELRVNSLSSKGAALEFWAELQDLVDVDVSAVQAAPALDLRGSTVTASGLDILNNQGGTSVLASVLRVEDLRQRGVSGATVTGLRLRNPTLRLSVPDLQTPAEAEALRLSLSAVDGVQEVWINLPKQEVDLRHNRQLATLNHLRTCVETVLGQPHATPVALPTPSLQLSDLRISQLQATGACSGLKVEAEGTFSLSSLSLTDLAGDTVLGLSVHGKEACSLVDLRIQNLTAQSGAALGLLLHADHPHLRGLTVTRVQGLPAAGLILRGGAPDLEGARVAEISGGGALGVGIFCPPGLLPLRVADLSVEAVSGTASLAAEDLAATEASSVWEDWDGKLPLPAPVRLYGLLISAPVLPDDAVLDEGEPAAILLQDLVLRRIGGTALQVAAALRPLQVRRTEIVQAARGALIASDSSFWTAGSFHQLREGLLVGPGELFFYNSVFTSITDNQALRLGSESRLAGGGGLYAELGGSLWRSLPTAGVYLSAPAGAAPISVETGAIPPSSSIDLRPNPAMPASVAVAGEASVHPHIGAWAPSQSQAKLAEDPLRTPLSEAPKPVALPPVDSLAHDYPRLLALLLQRARTTMPAWEQRDAADLTTTLFEAYAYRLDQLAWAQERVLTESTLETARLRRSVEDHARVLDCLPDPGLSACTLVRMSLDLSRLSGLTKDLLVAQEVRDLLDTSQTNAVSDPAERERQIHGRVREALGRVGLLNPPLVLPGQSLLTNEAGAEDLLVFATEQRLEWHWDLHRMRLLTGVAAGSTSAVLALEASATRLDTVLEGRWLLFVDPKSDQRHPVRVTRARRTAAGVEIFWDPRRPLPVALGGLDRGTLAEAAEVWGNVGVAWHGLPLAAPDQEPEDPLPIQRWLHMLKVELSGAPGLEVPVPLSPLSRQATGLPFPGEGPRSGTLCLRVQVEEDVWTQVDDLSTADPSDEVYVLRTGADGKPVLRFGDGVNGASLPRRPLTLSFSLTLGLGAAGNVRTGAVCRLLQPGAPEGGDLDPARRLGGLPGPGRLEALRALVQISSCIPAEGGRDPEALERLRYRAPLSIRTPLSAVAPRDYERILLRMPEVAGVRARVRHGVTRPVVRVTVLLRDDDQLDPAERLRRFSRVRRQLEEIRLLGVDVELVPPAWVHLHLALEVEAEAHTAATSLRDAVRTALAGNGGALDPDSLGLGGDVHLSKLYEAVLAVPGVSSVVFRRLARAPTQLLDPHAVFPLGGNLDAPNLITQGVLPVGPEEVATLRRLSEGDGILDIQISGGLR